MNESAAGSGQAPGSGALATHIRVGPTHTLLAAVGTGQFAIRVQGKPTVSLSSRGCNCSVFVFYLVLHSIDLY